IDTGTDTDTGTGTDTDTEVGHPAFSCPNCGGRNFIRSPERGEEACAACDMDLPSMRQATA
ncbi:MAG: aldehyde dehydrogenase (NADP(+)), partial [Candidatus Methanomethylicaceae archaeon]